MKEILVLNRSFLPLGTINLERALCLIYLGKANTVKGSGKFMKSVNVSLEVPEIITLPNVSYVAKHTIAPSRKNVFKRDNYTCKYCNRDYKHNTSKLTIDHIIPRSRFQKIAKEKNLDYKVSSWQNLVTSCRDCNSHKDSHLLGEIGWPDVTVREPFHALEIDWQKLFDQS